EVIGCPIIREQDGLAKSSRNTYLNEKERIAALTLHNSIIRGKKLLKKGERDAVVLVNTMKAVIEKEPLAKIDYLKVVDAVSMQPVEKIKGTVLIAMAVYIGNTRLIDNFIYEETREGRLLE
ncbi:MAG: pantoate--beta-alanine ligase, partial [Lachnospiraceae bacterium]|nr:pantoate--beta-alanine ligase [Lachnospiraceae bacterium]